VAIQFGQIPNFVGLQLKGSVIVIDKCLDKQLLVHVIDFTESFTEQPKELLINSLHHATLNDHINEFTLVPLGDVHLQYFVCALFEIDSRLDCQIYCTP